MTWQRGSSPFATPVVVVDAAGVGTVQSPRLCTDFLAALRGIAAAQCTWQEVGAWLRIKGGLDALAETHPEVRAAYEEGYRQGIGEMRAAMLRAKPRSQREARELREIARLLAKLN